MTHERRTPTWLLRDMSALLGLAACFAMFIWPFIHEGFRVARGHQPREDRMTRIAHLLLNAEATLAYALWREAYRRLGYNPRLVRLELADLPATRRELLDRIRSYLDQFQNLSRAASHYTALLRQRWGAASVPAAQGATGARRAAQHGLNAAVSRAGPRSALMVSSARSARPSNHAGVLTNARGPPLSADCRLPDLYRLSVPRV